MTSKRLTLPIVATSALFILIGCEAAPSNDSTNTPPTTDQTTQAEVTETADETEMLSTEEALAPTSEEDHTLYNGAITLKDESYCDKIEDENLQTDCKEKLTTLAVIDKAMKANDIALCQELAGVQVDVCTVEFKQAQQLIDDFRVPSEEENEVMRRAQDERNASICDEIESERKKENCKINVEAVLNYDQSVYVSN